MSNTQPVTDHEDVSTEKTGVRPTVQGRPRRSGSPNGAVVFSPSVRREQSIPGERTVVSPGRPAKPSPMIVGHPRSPEVPQSGGFTKALRGACTFPFKALGAVCVSFGRALRAVYWVLDSDAKVRSQGLQTVGRVVATKTEEHRDPESGTSYTHHVTYEYQVDGRKHTYTKQVGNLKSLSKGVPIRVYFLPDTYPLACALNGQPRALDERARRDMEASSGRTERGGVEVSDGSRQR